MHYLLHTDRWEGLGLPSYTDYASVRARTAVLDQCTMNSYMVHPWQRLKGGAAIAGATR